VDCDQVRSGLNAFCDGELPPTNRDRVQAHLRICAECRQMLARLERLAELLDRTAPSPVPENLTQRILSRACLQMANRAAIGKPSVHTRSWWKTLSAHQWAAAAAVLVMGLSAGTWMGWQTAKRRPADVAFRPPAEVPEAVSNLDYLGGTPHGSLPKAYLVLVDAPARRGE
jgi:anti-sigma factor RsiW